MPGAAGLARRTLWRQQRESKMAGGYPMTKGGSVKGGGKKKGGKKKGKGGKSPMHKAVKMMGGY